MGDLLDNLKELDYKKIITYVIIPLLLLAGFFTVPLEKKVIEFPAELYVSEQAKFVDIRNIEEKQKTTLNFGGVSAGYKVEKLINLQMSDGAPPSDVTFNVDGKIKDFVEIRLAGSNDMITGFVIKSPTSVSVKVNVPVDAEPGDYYGTVQVVYSKTLFRKLLNLLNI